MLAAAQHSVVLDKGRASVEARGEDLGEGEGGGVRVRVRVTARLLLVRRPIDRHWQVAVGDATGWAGRLDHLG